MLEIKDFSASIADKTSEKQILTDINMDVNPGELHLIMGPNGAGKSTLLRGLMGIDEVKTSGQIILDEKTLTALSIDERARSGLFIGSQSPVEIPGVHLVEFLRTAHNLIHPDDKYDPWTFKEMFEALAVGVGLPQSFSERNLNEGFSGGEKKRSEVLQMLLLRPKYAFLDEIDSGLDIESLKDIFLAIHDYIEREFSGVVLITHNPNILEYVLPTHVHLLKDGQIKTTGGVDLVERIISKGYQL